MPKEMITYPIATEMHRDCLGEECTCTPVADVWPQVAVRWAPVGTDQGGNVQISLIEYEKPVWSEWVERASEALKTQSHIRDRDLLTEERETFSVVLSRSELNDLIRVLRRARDQAYGRDE